MIYSPAGTLKTMLNECYHIVQLASIFGGKNKDKDPDHDSSVFCEDPEESSEHATPKLSDV